MAMLMCYLPVVEINLGKARGRKTKRDSQKVLIQTIFAIIAKKKHWKSDCAKKKKQYSSFFVAENETKSDDKIVLVDHEKSTS